MSKTYTQIKYLQEKKYFFYKWLQLTYTVITSQRQCHIMQMSMAIVVYRPYFGCWTLTLITRLTIMLHQGNLSASLTYPQFLSYFTKEKKVI